MLHLDATSSALVLIDLQAGILRMPLAPRSGEEVVAKAKTLASRFRSAQAPVIVVHVDWAADFADALHQVVDQPMASPENGLPEDWGTIAPGLARPDDIHITKRQWSAFYGTDLDLQLRRRGIKTIVLGGIATNFGVESTGRQAWEHGYEIFLVEDVTSSISSALHDMAVQSVFPRIARVIQSDAVGFANT